jgi:tetratricopeptide (TPR) repeat protein
MEALVRLIGAGAATLAAGLPIAVAGGAVAAGDRLIGALAEDEPAATRGLLERTITGMLQTRERSGLPVTELERYAQMLPDVLESFRPTPDGLAAAFRAPADTAALDDAAWRLTAEVVTQGRAAAAFGHLGLDESVVGLLLERLFGLMLAERGTIAALARTIAPVLASAPDDGGGSRSGTTPVEALALALQAITDGDDADGPGEPSEAVPTDPAEQSSASPLANRLTAAGESVMARRLAPGSESENGAASVASALERCNDLIDRLNYGLPSSTPAGALRLRAAARLSEGDFEEADRALREAEGVDVRAAQTDLGLSHQYLTAAAETRAARGRLAEISGDPRRALRHLASAVRCLPKSERGVRWSFLVRQANLLLGEDDAARDDAARTEAIRLLTQAGQQLTTADGHAGWAAGQLRLANLLIANGLKWRETQPYLDAMPLLEGAIAIFSRTRMERQVALSHASLGTARWAFGQSANSVMAVEDSVMSYRAALEGLDRESAPDIWTKAQSELGEALLWLGRTTGNAERIAAAVVPLEAVTGAPGLSPGARAQAGARLGQVLWMLGERRAEPALLNHAAQVQLRALDLFESVGDEANAQRVRADLDTLSEALEHAAEPGPPSTARLV